MFGVDEDWFSKQQEEDDGMSGHPQSDDSDQMN